jgi:hypothetical protein
MAFENPYAADLGGQAPLAALAATPARLRQLVGHWSESQFERRYAPGKWTAREVLIHLAQTELALGTRTRFALAERGYAAQAFSQDDWMPIDAGLDAKTALDAYLSMRRMNLGMWRALTPEQTGRAFSHPEYGDLTVGWIMAQMAGHDIHHLRQLESI